MNGSEQEEMTMSETTERQPTEPETTVAPPTKRRSVGTRILEAEAHWLMGRVMPHDFLDAVYDYVNLVAPEGDDELIDAIRGRAEQLADANKDLVVDGPSKGALALCAVVLAAFEKLQPLFDGDQRRTILYLQQAMGGVLRRPYEQAFKALSERDRPLDKIDKACRMTGALYGAGWNIGFERPEPGLFEIKVDRCFFRDFFARHDVTPVTTVMCAWDVNFMRVIDPAVSGLRAERTSLMSLGDRECRFAVLETDDPLAGYTDTLDQRVVD
jgi:L-2-amino-thiazoline-4-carboxylic acid hydrolase